MAFKDNDLDTLMAAGVPLAGERDVSSPIDFALISEILVSGLDETVDAKTRDSIRAWLLALRDHYPTIFKQFFGDPKLLAELRSPLSGRDIKLRRIALSHLGKVA